MSKREELLASFTYYQIFGVLVADSATLAGIVNCMIDRCQIDLLLNASSSSVRKSIGKQIGTIVDKLVEDPDISERAFELCCEKRDKDMEIETKWRKQIITRLGWLRAREYLATVDFALDNIRGYKEQHLREIQSTLFA